MAYDPFKTNKKLQKTILGTAGNKKKKRRKCPPHLKYAIRRRWWKDNYVEECFCCGRKNLHYEDAEVGHIKASSKGGKWAPENCRLICRKCNSGMRNTNMKTYMKRYYPERFKKKFPKESKKKTRKKRKTKRKRPSSIFAPTQDWGFK